MISYYLVGADGSRWDLSDPDSPIRLVTDPDGLDGPPRTAAMQENVNQGGAYYKGQQDKSNVIKMALRFGSGRGFDGDELVEAATGWRRALGTGRDLAEFHVVDEDGGTDRWQWVRNLDTYAGPSPSRLRDVGYVGTAQVSVTSDGAYWESRPIDVPYVTYSSTLSSRADFPSWPQWEVTGPTTQLKIGLDGEQIALADLTAGHTYTIDTDPTCPRIHRNGVDAWAVAAGRQSFRKPAPPIDQTGKPVTVPISVSGGWTGLRLILPQQHWAAIG